MLVLTRHRNQAITLTLKSGEVIKLTVVDVGRKRRICRLGIDAPDDVSILRDDAIKRTKGGKGIEDREDGLPRSAGTDGTEPPLSLERSGAVPTE